MLNMKDASCAYWFKVGDKVKVTSPVMKGGHDLKGRIGEVIETFEKCDVDPTCCCAEFVDDNFAVRVSFKGTVDPNNQGGGNSFIQGIDTFTHYFNEDELVKFQQSESDDPVAFDGMSCVAFKQGQLKMGEQAKRIAAYEESLKQDD